VLKPTERFSDRVSNYIKYRPSYPSELIDTLTSECHLSSRSIIADIGSGTGKFSKLLLDRNYRVNSVEPNKEMREAAEYQFSKLSNFVSVEGESEKTNLENSSVDLITAAQAFHWFKREEARKEFERILKATGYVALIWNQRKLDLPFQKEYEQMLREFATDYKAVNHMNLTIDDFADFYYPNEVSTYKFANTQHLDLVGFLGRMQSSSYTPKADTKEYDILIKVAENLFSKFENEGSISFDYEAFLYLGKFTH
jgi:ubiquinone/menaquinone biosynthesis C-methylase UbiE